MYFRELGMINDEKLLLVH